MRSLPLRKLAFIIVLTDVILLCVVAALAVDADWLAEARRLFQDTSVAEPAVAVLADSKRTNTDAEAQEPAPASPAPRSGRKIERDSADFNTRTIVFAAAIFALVFVAPSLSMCCFFVLLRRHVQRYGPLVQVHNAIAPPAVIGLPSMSHHGTSARRPDDMPDLPDFLQPEAPRGKGGALFERLFEETIELQKEMDGSEAK